MKTILKLIIINFLLTFVLISCGNDNSQQPKELDENKLQEPLMKANKQAVKTEDDQIINYINRHKWDMKATGSGLRYAIYKHGSGAKAETGKIAIINYTVELISGEQIYSSDKEGSKEFLIGKGGVESGIEEGILLLHIGDHAKFIIPSHLGFGLLGDQNKVPPKSTLIYDIELLDLK